MTAPWLSVIGIGEDGLDGLSPSARALLDRAELLVGGTRHLAMLPEDGRERWPWPSPMTPMLDRIAGERGRRVCILASGDPMWFGVGASLARRIPPAEMLVLPAPSAFSLAAARLGWPLAETVCLSLCGRPLAAVNAALAPGARLLLLSQDGETPAQIAQLLADSGWGDSRMVVLERMGGPQEGRIEGAAADWSAPRCADLNTVAVACVASPWARPLPALAGLPDDAFRHDGQLTKREVRAATLARLAPLPGQTLWDVGAGCGSIAIEWLRAAPRSQAFAVERDPDRGAMILANAEALGVLRLRLVPGEAPAALDGLPPPDAVFIGGGIGGNGILERCWDALRPGGILVANTVTAEGERAILDWQASHGGDLVRIAISRAAPVGRRLGWRPMMPVTQLAAVKP
ncbi:MAG: precorrin-6y C5,15-methyltransferase (decarboxylating) subunit CbiE [Alphaproteobacteria bacterium]